MQSEKSVIPCPCKKDCADTGCNYAPNCNTNVKAEHCSNGLDDNQN